MERSGHQHFGDAEWERTLVSAPRHELRSVRTWNNRVARRRGVLRGAPRVRVVQECVRHHRHSLPPHRLRGRCRAGVHPRPEDQPTKCAQPTPLASPLAYFDPDFRFPRSLKVALGVDRALPWGVVGTVDVLYTRLVNSVEMVDVNLRGPVGTSAGEGGRVLYGTIDESTGRATPSRVTDGAGQSRPAAERQRGSLLLGHGPTRAALLRRDRSKRGVHLHRREGPDGHGRRPRQ